MLRVAPLGIAGFVLAAMLTACTLGDVIATWGVLHYAIDQQCDAADRFDARARRQSPLGEGMARLVVFRQATVIASGLRPDLALDGRNLGALEAGRVIVVDVPAGEHRLDGGSDAKHALVLALTAGETRVVQATPQPGWWNGWLLLAEITGEQAAGQLGTLCVRPLPDKATVQ
ncbi:hypothetical protein [Niveibacterium sp. COAC-50]|uniref:hypothetical protein n=1 Tax=Niveibacterium sp. COAC-50 TaxID=2729384 RepID=UPI001554333B|nr:hypothetical protein [Niveibacterium sp. COAC-50]